MIAALFAHWFPPSVASAARTLGHLGGQARAKQLREPIRAKARLMREQGALEPDPRLAG